MASLTIKERTASLVILTAILLFILILIADSGFSMIFQQDLFISGHLLLEFSSIVISYAIALQCWFTFPHESVRYRVLLGALFLTVGSIDLMHTLTYKGMPTFFTETSVAKATWFWVIARLTEAVAFTWILLRGDWKIAASKLWPTYLVSAVYAFTTSIIVANYSEVLPVLVIDGKGVTTLKIILEYIVSILHLLTAGWLIAQYTRDREQYKLDMVQALVLILLGELVFTLYEDVYQLKNLLGHVYKTTGYFFLLTALYVPAVHAPFERERQAKASLEAVKEELNNFFMLAMDMLAIVDNRKFKRINKAFVKCLGYTEQEILSQPWSFFVHPEDIERSRSEVEQKINNGKSIKQFQNRYRTKAGSYKWLEWDVVYDSVKCVAYCIARDITERKQMDTNLRESEEKFRKAFEESGIGKALMALDYRWLKVNRSLCDLVGYSEQEMLELMFQDITHPDDLAIDLQYAEQLVKGGVPYFQWEKRYIHKQGHILWVLINMSLIRDEQGTPLYFIGQIQDITELHKAQEKNSFLACLIESTDDAIIGNTIDGVITSWNRAAEKILGYKPEEVIGRSILDLLPPERRFEMYEVFAKIRRGEKVPDFEIVCVTKDGRHMQTWQTISPVVGKKGDILGVSMIACDITERRQMEKELARLDRLNLVGELAASISHEVRNPMTTVRGYLQLMRKKQEYSARWEQLDLMIEELDRANGIISEFLSIGRNKLTKKKVNNLNHIIETLTPLIQADVITQGKELVLKLKETADLLLDENEIRQLILNLSRNGLEAMKPKGSLTIRTWQDSDVVILAVQDEGPGMPPAVVEKLGTPFFTTKENGTGIGLGVCYSIVDRHSATIDYTTSPAGTTFYVRFVNAVVSVQ